jgi:hypothetical protein
LFSAGNKIALLSAGKEPERCPRSIPIAPALQRAGVSGVHLRPDGGALVDSLFDPSQVWLTDDPGLS